MSYDGRALHSARETIRRIKENNEAEQKHRRTKAFLLEPELEALDRQMTQLMTGLALTALKRGEDAGAAVRNAKEESHRIIERREALLEKHGLPRDYLNEIYSCAKCSDTGYFKGEVCTCLEKAYNGEAARLLSSMLNTEGQSFERFDISLYEPEEPSAISAGQVRTAMSDIHQMCRAYAQGFGHNSVNLLFCGGTGLGKTFLSACIAKVVLEKGFSVVYDSCVIMIEAFEAQKFERGAENAADTSAQIRRYLNCDLLILDDLGTEMTTSFTQSALYMLINTRLINGKKTIISTNLTDTELERRYTAQIASRLRGEYEVLQFKGRDIREVKKERGL